MFILLQTSRDFHIEPDELIFPVAYKTIHEAKVVIEKDIHEFWEDNYPDGEVLPPEFINWIGTEYSNQKLGLSEFMCLEYIIAEVELQP